LGFLSLRIPHGADVNRVQKAKYSNRKWNSLIYRPKRVNSLCYSNLPSTLPSSATPHLAALVSPTHWSIISYPITYVSSLLSQTITDLQSPILSRPFNTLAVRRIRH
jgi:hypothetical protein